MTEESDRIPGVLPETGDHPAAEADAVLEESAKLAAITRERRRKAKSDADAEIVFELRDLSVTYGGTYAVEGVTMSIRKNKITAFIGPSGCGKTTVLRCFNRMNDLIDGARVDGSVHYHGNDLYGPKVDPVEVRRRIGMVFQKPNPFPKSIYDNVAFGPRVGGKKGTGRSRRAVAPTRGALGRGQEQPQGTAMALSGGQQQRLCIARASRSAGRPADGRAVLCARPDRDAPDRGPDARAGVEYTIVVVTHNMQQAARVGDRTAFFTVSERRTTRTPDRHPRRVRRDDHGVHQPERFPDRGLRDGPVRLAGADPEPVVPPLLAAHSVSASPGPGTPCASWAIPRRKTMRWPRVPVDCCLPVRLSVTSSSPMGVKPRATWKATVWLGEGRRRARSAARSSGRSRRSVHRAAAQDPGA